MHKYHGMKVYKGVKVKLYAFLTSELDGEEWYTLRSSHFTPVGIISRYAMNCRLLGLQSWPARDREEKFLSLAVVGP
jgi:hypothetical protein